MNKGVNYSMFYDILLNLREEFHSYGRIDDSNAKLDEMIKLICTSYSMALSGMQFSLEHIRQVALSHFGNQDMVAAALRYVCENEMQKSTNSSTKILSESPSVTMIDSSDYVGNNLKPSFYAAERFKTIKNLRNSVAEGFRIAKLGDIVEFTAKSRKSYMVSDTIKHISVLHQEHWGHNGQDHILDHSTLQTIKEDMTNYRIDW